MSLRTRAVGALVAAGGLWGSTFALGKVVLAETTPAWLIVLRLGVAVAVLAPFVPWRRVAWSPARLVHVAGGGLLAGVVMFWLQFEGLARTSATSAALLVAVAPPLLAVAAARVDGEIPDRATWWAVGLSAVGVAVLAGAPGPGRTLAGDLLCAVSMCGAVAWTLVSRRLARDVGAMAAVTAQFAAALPVVAALALWRDGPLAPLSPGVWAAIGLLGVGCTAATFVLWNWGVLHVEAARAGVIANLEPVIGTALGVGLLDETLTPRAAAGGALLVAAAMYAAVAATRPRLVSDA